MSLVSIQLVRLIHARLATQGLCGVTPRCHACCVIHGVSREKKEKKKEKKKKKEEEEEEEEEKDLGGGIMDWGGRKENKRIGKPGPAARGGR
eukprot:1158323-Pelagomonas_calceolata.AAC.3